MLKRRLIVIEKNDPKFVKKLKADYNTNAVWDAFGAGLLDEHVLKEILDSYKTKKTFWSWLWEW